ncbi:hypothetical protein MRX96_051741 [Rhipicephalus microplus]
MRAALGHPGPPLERETVARPSKRDSPGFASVSKKALRPEKKAAISFAPPPLEAKQAASARPAACRAPGMGGGPLEL